MENYLIAKATDTGVAREVNEDSMGVFATPNGQVLVVCDGMGGQAAGDVASQMSVSIIEDILTDNTFPTPEDAIRSSVIAANQAILHRTAQNPDLEGMGSTCVMLLVKENKVHCGWVGDSRIYYIANGSMRQISHDQSYVQQLVDAGQITSTQAANHPQKNEITNCIGLDGMMPPVTTTVQPEPGSVFLLCSDGLTGMVSDEIIENVILNPDNSLQEKADELVALANAAGGLDNITVELIQFGADKNGLASKAQNQKGKQGAQQKSAKSNLITMIVAAVVALAAVGGGAYWMMQDNDKPAQKKIEVPATKASSSEEHSESKHSSSSTSTSTTTTKSSSSSSRPSKSTNSASDYANTIRNTSKSTNKNEEKKNNALKDIKSNQKEYSSKENSSKENSSKETKSAPKNDEKIIL